mmetsp:Transcript_24243/g.30050  ORF Transcript_24243/g.30050 Transcript_24243/m.30050 type:complete len:90 (+) Transcript_24243:2191-2460(+)
MPQDEHARIQFVWHTACGPIDAPNLELNVCDLAFDFLRCHVVFIFNGFLLESGELDNAIALLGDEVLSDAEPLQLGFPSVCVCPLTMIS